MSSSSRPPRSLGGTFRRSLLCLLVIMGCGEETGLQDPEQIELTGFSVEAVDMHTIRLRWPNAGVNAYRLDRRADLEGDFEPVVQLPPAATTHLDRALTPSTLYGYRLVALNALGQVLGTSTVGSATTAPEPGIEITTRSSGGPEAEDLDGYTALISRDTDHMSFAMPGNGTELVSPLNPGVFTVALAGLAPQCAPVNGLSKAVPVTDAGLNTVAKVTFEITCRDPTRAKLTVPVTVVGDTTDSDGVRLILSGIADDTSLPPDQRSVLIIRDIGPNGATATYENLRPGTYGLVVEDVATYCTLTPPQRDNIDLDALDDEELGFTLDCRGAGGTSGPFKLRAFFTPDSAEAQQKTQLDLTLDLTAAQGTSVGAFSMVVRVNQAVARIDSVKVASPFAGAANPNPSTGRVALSFFTASAPSGVVPLGRIYYTAVGGANAVTAVEITNLAVTSGSGSSIQDQVGVEDGTFTVAKKLGTGSGGGGTNRPPVAEAGGPYQAAAGQPVQLSAAGSTDPDGQIASYAWSFGDQTSGGSGANVSHTYAAAGTYTTSLTVTDNKGATATDQATVTVSPATQPSTKAFTWKSTFGSVGADNKVNLTLTLDLRADLPETPGPERLTSWELDSLKFDPAALEFSTWTAGSGTSTLSTSALSRGIIRIQGTPAANKSGGLVTVGTVTFTVKQPGATSASLRASASRLAGTTETTTWLGLIQGHGASSSEIVSYDTRVGVQEGTLTLPDGPPPTGTTVSGAVSSPQQGGLAGVTVSASGAGTGTTGSGGAWSIAGVPAGSRSVTLSNLPSGCTNPGAQTITVATTPVTNVNFTVTCPAPAGTTVSGTVTSPQQGPLAGATVGISGAGSATTAFDGSWTVPGVAAGSRTVSLGNLPPGCADPGSQTITVASSPVTNVAFTVTCAEAPAAGTVTGTITFAAGSATPSLATVTISVDPSAADAANATGNVSAGGSFSVSGVAIGAGTGAGAGVVTFGSLPTGCAFTGVNSLNYTGLQGGQTVNAGSLQIDCLAAGPVQYPWSSSFSAPSGGQTTMTIRIDMSVTNRPDNNGTNPDLIGGFSALFLYPENRLSSPTCGAQSGFGGAINTAIGAGKIGMSLTNATGASGNVVLLTCTFNITAGTGGVTSFGNTPTVLDVAGTNINTLGYVLFNHGTVPTVP